MNKSYLEIASELVSSMVSRGMILCPKKTDEPWEKYNMRAIHTIGFAMLEMYREVGAVPAKARYQPKRAESAKKIIPAR